MKTQSRPPGDRAPRPDADAKPGNGTPGKERLAARTGTLPTRPPTARPATTTTYVPAPEEALAPLPVAPPREEEVAPSGGPGSWLTLETALYIAVFALAMVTRFWDLDSKGLHHDESLHAVYSWKYYTNLGYVHSPMMHGPEQFHFIDVFYLLFGATDATARFASAICGVFIVMAPLFLRRQLGRWPALVASFLLLISPGFMYFTRFAREDAIYAAMEMLFVMGLWRFVSERKPRDFYMLCAGYSLMFTIKESAYLTTAVIGLLLVGLFAWQMGRLLFSTFLAYLAAVGGLALIILKMPGAPKLPNIPAQDPTPENISAFVTGLISHPLIQVVAGVSVLWLAVWGYLLWDQSKRVRDAARPSVAPARRASRTNLPVRTVAPAVAAVPEAEISTAATVAEAPDAAVAVVHESELGDGAQTIHLAPSSAVETNGHDNGHGDNEVYDDMATGDLEVVDGDGMEPEAVDEPVEVVPSPRPAAGLAPAAPGLLERYEPGSLPYAVGYLLRNPAVLLTGLGVAVLLFVALYTSLFSNINGIGTGLFGSIGYWLAQQDVRRGDQPWFYYGILIPIYEPLIIFFGVVGILYFAWKGMQSLVENRRTATLLFVLGVLFFPVAIPVFIVAMLVRAFRHVPEDDVPAVPGATTGFNVGRPVEFSETRPFIVLFLVAWFLGATGLYSWAGEKMPWLMVHMVQPLAFLAALALGQVAKSMIRNRRARALRYAPPVVEAPPAGRRGAPVYYDASTPGEVLASPVSWVPFFSFISLFVLVSVFWSMSITHRVANNDYENWWQLLIWPALLLVLVAGYWSLVGGARVARYGLVAVMLLLSVYGIRSAIQLSFFNAMDAREMAVYVQTDPDTTRAADTIDRLSVEQTGGRDLKVMYDSQSSWPWEWYFRDYKNKQFQPSGPSTAPEAGVAVLVLDSAWYDKAKSGQAPQLDNYVGTKYPMRWWYPEDTYRNFIPSTWDDLDPVTPFKEDGTPNFRIDATGKQAKGPVRQIQGALDTIFYTLRTPSEQGKIWKYLVYRQPYQALGSTDMAVFVRRDLVERYNYLASLQLPDYDSRISH